MCGILANFNYNVKINKKHLKLIENRGLDNFGITDFNEIKNYFKVDKIHEVPNNFIFHNLHAIVSQVNQPILKKYFYFATNCEIYNYKNLKQNANSDSLVLFDLLTSSLLPLKLNDRDELIKQSLNALKIELNKVDGVFSFILYNKRDNLVFIAKDFFGIKPMKYAFENNNLLICSEGKVIEKIFDDNNINNLDGNKIICFDLNNNKMCDEEIDSNLYEVNGKYIKDENKILNELDNLMVSSIKKRVPKNIKFGVLFSGGIDSTLIVMILKHLGYNFVCYNSCFASDDMRVSPDFTFAQTFCKENNIEFKSNFCTMFNLKKNIKTVASIIEDVDPIKLGVALPFYFVSQLAKKDSVDVLFSGLGSEECFAGYSRHLDILNAGGDVNKECIEGFKNIQFRDLYRDDLILMSNNIELRLPFLDKDLVKYSFLIDSSLKINDEQKKIILRKYARKYIKDELFINRKKLGAQYGSNFDKAIIKLAKEKGFKSKKEFVNSLK